MTVMRKMMSKLKLTVNETKTRLCRLPEESFDFLGHTLGRNYDCRTGKSYVGPRPSRKKIDRLCREISELTERRKAWQDVEVLIGRINQKLRGWSGYFRIGTVSKAYRSINSHTRHRVRQWLCAKFKEPGQGKKRFSDLSLIHISLRTRSADSHRWGRAGVTMPVFCFALNSTCSRPWKPRRWSLMPQ